MTNRLNLKRNCMFSSDLLKPRYHYVHHKNVVVMRWLVFHVWKTNDFHVFVKYDIEFDVRFYIVA